MMNINAVSDWITDASKGDQTVYYTGWLIKDRGRSNSELSHIANYVWSMKEQGFVHLVQKKTPIWTKHYSEYDYIMQRSSKDRI